MASWWLELERELERETGGAAAGGDVCHELPTSAFAAGECASGTLAAALSAHDWVSVPRLSFPLLLDRPVVLSSGQRLSVHPETVVRLLPGCGGVMVRNRHPFDGRRCASVGGCGDHDLCVEGGVWEEAGSGVSPQDDSPEMQAFGRGRLTLRDGEGRETNVAGSEGDGGMLLGVLFFSAAQRVTVRGLTIRHCHFYGVLMSGCDHFVVEDVRFERNCMDGVHVNGPSSHGLIQRLSGKTGDDFVALNAWDWWLSAVSFGSIHHVLVRDLDSDGDELRLLPGRKTYAGGSQVACPIHDCVCRRVRNIYCVKLYQQPNCANDLTGQRDCSDIPGQLSRIAFLDVDFGVLREVGLGEVPVNALFEVAVDVSDLHLEGIRVAQPAEAFRAAGRRLVEVGPKSSTWKRGHGDPSQWAELFDTEMVCRAERVAVRDVAFDGVPCRDRDLLAGCHALQPNPDYPRTTPRGGHGYGVLSGLEIG